MWKLFIGTGCGFCWGAALMRAGHLPEADGAAQKFVIAGLVTLVLWGLTFLSTAVDSLSEKKK